MAYISELSLIVVSYRGSENVENWINNLEFRKAPVHFAGGGPTGAAVHTGFQVAYESARNKVQIYSKIV